MEWTARRIESAAAAAGWEVPRIPLGVLHTLLAGHHQIGISVGRHTDCSVMLSVIQTDLRLRLHLHLHIVVVVSTVARHQSFLLY